MKEVNKSSEWTHFPIVRKSDKTIVNYIDNLEGVAVQVSMELDKDNKVLSKKITPLNEFFA